MCGRYSVYTEEEVIEMREILEEVNRRYAGSSEMETMSRGEVFPTQRAPVLVKAPGGRAARLMRWGFPKWQGPGVIINARGETAAQKPTFRGPLQSGRCVVPTTGFYEWRHEGGKTKEKYIFRLPGAPMVYLAGLYRRFSPPGEGPFDGYVIVTTQANPTVIPYHDRMPLVLLPGQLAGWLEDGELAQALAAAPCDVELTATAV